MNSKKCFIVKKPRRGKLVYLVSLKEDDIYIFNSKKEAKEKCKEIRKSEKRSYERLTKYGGIPEDEARDLSFHYYEIHELEKDKKLYEDVLEEMKTGSFLFTFGIAFIIPVVARLLDSMIKKASNNEERKVAEG